MLKARERVVADLEALGLLDKVEDREIELAHSDRSKTPIEPYLADQWFVQDGPTWRQIGDGRRERRPRARSSRRATPRAISTGSAKSATGPSAGSFGGDIGFRSGMRRRASEADLKTRLRRPRRTSPGSRDEAARPAGSICAAGRRPGRPTPCPATRLDARRRRARHLVQLGPLAALDARLAGADAGA